MHLYVVSKAWRCYYSYCDRAKAVFSRLATGRSRVSLHNLYRFTGEKTLTKKAHQLLLDDNDGVSEVEGTYTIYVRTCIIHCGLVLATDFNDHLSSHTGQSETPTSSVVSDAVQVNT